MMQRIKLSHVKAGMVLAQAVVVDGVVLCAEGAELTPRVVERLAHREIEFVVVEGEPVEAGPAEQARMAEARAAIDRRFRRLDSDEFMMGVKSVFERQFGLVQPPQEPDKP